MYKKLFLFTLLFASVSSCMKHDFDNQQDARNEQIKKNVENVFGVTFSEDQDWCVTTKGSIKIVVNPTDFNDIKKVQILTQSPFGNGDGNEATILNEANVSYGEEITLYYDAPSYIDRLYAACVASTGELYIKGFNVGDETLSFSEKTNRTMSIEQSIVDKVNSLQNPTLGGSKTSYARNRGYAGFENDLLYDINDNLSTAIILDDYSLSMKQDLRDIIFTYLPNKKSNIEKIKLHEYYNSTSYPITTGEEPIIIEPIYKNDGGYKEVEKCALYYYYFTDAELEGKTEAEQVQYFKDLPKFRAIDMNDVVYGNGLNGGLSDDELKKSAGYVLAFWGESKTPSENTVGSFQFPKGYKIGFMLRNEGKDVHQGELYCDGRLNGEVNKWKHLASAKLGETDARMAWLSGNKKNFLCCESGTDRDFNDIVFEVEGGIEPIGNIPDVESNWYTYCFEDTELGDYDLNDLVIRARRLNSTQVEYNIVACGANDNLYAMGINGSKIKDNVEVHTLFNADSRFINTLKGQNYPAVVDVVNVSKSFSFTDESTMPYLYDANTGLTVRISKKGEDPHGIMVPKNFLYPLERVCVKDAYELFNSWGTGEIEGNDWYLYPTYNAIF